MAVVARVSDRGQQHDQCLAVLDLERDLVAGLHAVEKDRGRQYRHRAVFALDRAELGENPGVHQICGKLVVTQLAATRRLGFASRLRKVGIPEKRAWSHDDRDSTLQRLGLKIWRPSAQRLAEITMQHFDHRYWKRDVTVRIDHVLRRQPLRHHHQGHVADNFR